MGILASTLFQFGVSLQYVYLLMGILIGSAVAPISFSILWHKTNRYAATSAAIVGLVCGVVAWITSANLASGEITIASTGSLIPLLVGNITAIVTSLAITVIGSMAIPESFDFRILKQKILLVDDKVRSMLKHDTDEQVLARASKFYKRVGFGVTIFLVIVWPMSFYLTEYVFTVESFTDWIVLVAVWAFAAAAAVVILPFVEARQSIRIIITKAADSDIQREPEQDPPDAEPVMKILVPVDGSSRSLNALNNANYLFRGAASVKIYLLHVIEWSDDGESIDDDLSTQIQDEGRVVLRSIVVPKQINDYTRMVKLGDPPTRIAELADKLGVDLIAMGRKGLGNTDKDYGHVTTKVLKLTSKPVMLLN